MQDKDKFNPLAVVLGTTFVISLASGPVVNAANNPFNMIDLGSGYMVAEEGSCGDKKEEGKCGEGIIFAIENEFITGTTIDIDGGWLIS